MAIVRRDGDPNPPTPSPMSLQGTERFDPFRLMNEMLRWEPFRAMREVGPMSGFTPAFDVHETSDSYVIEADVPGMKDKDLDINLVGNRLTISGKREARQENKGEQYYTYERQYGSFMRAFTLPEGVDLDHIDAGVDDGVLRVTIPKGEKYKPRKITIKERVKQALKS